MGNTEGVRPLGQRSCLMYIKVGVFTDARGRSSSDMFGKIILVLSVLACASAQIPNLGFCPEYIPMSNFNMQRVSNNYFNSQFVCFVIHILFYFICGTLNIMLIYKIYFNHDNYRTNISEKLNFLWHCRIFVLSVSLAMFNQKVNSNLGSRNNFINNGCLTFL